MVVNATAPAAIPLSTLASSRHAGTSASTVVAASPSNSQTHPRSQQSQSQSQPQPQPQPQPQTQTTTATTRHAYLIGNTLPRHQTPLTWRDRLETAFSLGNGIGTITLILAIVFGIGAWVGMNIQISQGGKSLELTIWATCADHEAIQQSQVCKSILSKDFDDLQKRDDRSGRDLAVVVRRDELGALGDVEVVDASAAYEQQTPYYKLLSTLSDNDRAMVDINNGEYDYHRMSDPAFRAMIFPLVDTLTVPIRWFFALIESFLLIIIYCIHKIFSWLTWIVIWLFQCYCYSFVESMVKQFLASLDEAILQLLPAWAPSILFSNAASLIGLTFLRSYWYGASWYLSLKWIFIFRMAMWLIIEGTKLGYHLWSTWRANLERRRLQRDYQDAVQSVGGAGAEVAAPYVF